jgi:PAS domain S-box-containing protein
MKKSYSDIITETSRPVITIDELGKVTFISEAFTKEYGWTPHDLVGKLVTTIMPPHMRDAHNIGFSRFLITEHPTLLGKELPLPVYCKDGAAKSAIHYIVGEKYGETWRFAATITPANPGQP